MTENAAPKTEEEIEAEARRVQLWAIDVTTALAKAGLVTMKPPVEGAPPFPYPSDADGLVPGAFLPFGEPNVCAQAVALLQAHIKHRLAEQAAPVVSAARH